MSKKNRRLLAYYETGSKIDNGRSLILENGMIEITQGDNIVTLSGQELRTALTMRDEIFEDFNRLRRRCCLRRIKNPSVKVTT